MKTLFQITFALLLVAGPVTRTLAQKSVYILPFENQTRLPAMDVSINMESVSNSYLTGGPVFTSEINGPEDETLEQVSTSYINDEKVVDAVRFMQYYLEDQLLMPGDNKHGTVEMNVIYFNQKNGFSVGSVVGVLTFGLVTLMGVPYGRSVTDVELEAVFYDPAGNFLAKYRGVGRGTKQLSVYNSSTRKAHQKAFKEALDDLNTRIMSDNNLTTLISYENVNH